MKRLLFLIFVIGTLYALDEKQICGYNSSALEKVSKGANVAVGGDFIYWAPHEDGLYYVREAQTIKSGDDAYIETMIGDLRKVKPSHEPGFKLRASYDYCYDYWNSNFSWTKLRSDAKDYYFGQGVNLWGHTSVQVAEFSKESWAKWKLNYNDFDLDLGRKFYVGKCFSLRPNVGLKGAIINQNLDIFYEWLQYRPVPNADHPAGSNTLNIKNNLSAFGIKSGVDLEYNFMKDIGIFSALDFSILNGQFDCYFRVTQRTTLPAITDKVNADSQDKFHQVIGNGHMLLGLNYGKFFGCNNRTYFNAKMGWEHVVWYGVNKMRHHMHKLQQGKFRQQNLNLVLEGLFVSASLKF